LLGRYDAGRGEDNDEKRSLSVASLNYIRGDHDKPLMLDTFAFHVPTGKGVRLHK
jgi:hypothetical protein